TRAGARAASWCGMEQLTFGDAGLAGPGGAAAVSQARPVSPVPATGYELERELAGGGAARIAGVDEGGRGAWAGPVMACAVVPRPGFPRPPAGLTASKRLTPKRREQLAGLLTDWAEAFGIGEASHEEVDALGMTAALRKAARRALGQLPQPPGIVLLDG